MQISHKDVIMTQLFYLFMLSHVLVIFVFTSCIVIVAVTFECFEICKANK